MALQKQLLGMAIQGGLDTKTSSHNVESVNFRELENVVQTKLGAFNKRPGYDLYSQTVLGGTNLDSGKAATTFKDELLLYTGEELVSYSSGTDSWVAKGNVKYALAQETGIASPGYICATPSMAIGNGTAVYAYVNNGDITAKVVDDETGSILATHTVESGGSAPRVAVISNRFFIFYNDGAAVKAKYLDAATPTTLSSALSIAGNVDYDIASIGSRIFYAYPDTTGAALGYVTLDATVVAPITVSDAQTYDMVSVSKASVNNVRLLMAQDTARGGGYAKTILYSYDLNVTHHAITGFGPGIAESFNNCAAISDPTDTTISRIFFTEGYGDVWTQTVTEVGVVSSAVLVKPGCVMASKPQVYGEAVYIAIARYQVTTTVKTAFLVDSDGKIIGKFGFEEFVRDTLTTWLAESVSVTGGIVFPAITIAEPQRESGTVLVPTSVNRYFADFSQSNNYFDSQLGDNLHINGGVMRMYDGEDVVEHGFLETPRTPTYAGETAGGTSTAGTYQMLIVYSWRDSKGQIHRSAPSGSLSWTNAGSKKVHILAYKTPLTDKVNVRADLYATAANGTIFHKFTEAGYSNDDYVSTAFIQINNIDFTSQDYLSNEALYTSGGALENIPAISSKYSTIYKNRVMLLSSDGQRLQYSKLRGQGEPVEFNDSLIMNLDPIGGDGVALGVLDDHMIIFKQRALLALTGEGPNNLGEQDDFRTPYRIASDVGCINPNSVVSTPQGLMFKSEKGIYLLQRGLSVKYIGDRVEEYNDLTITSATLVVGVNQVRFTTSENRVLVYDYSLDRWTTFTGPFTDSIDAVIFDDAYTVVREDGSLLKENLTSFSDAGSYITARIRSAWIKLSDILDYQRLYRLMLLGNYISPHELRVGLSYDFDETVQHEAVIDTADTFDPNIYGDGDYGDGSYGGAFPLYEWEIPAKIQKCQTFSFTIEDYYTTTYGEGFNLTHLMAEVGKKKGPGKKAHRNAAS